MQFNIDAVSQFEIVQTSLWEFLDDTIFAWIFWTCRRRISLYPPPQKKSWKLRCNHKQAICHL